VGIINFILRIAQTFNRSHYQAMQYIACCGGEANVLMHYNVGGMVSCRLRATFLSIYRELQAGGNA